MVKTGYKHARQTFVAVCLAAVGFNAQAAPVDCSPCTVSDANGAIWVNLSSPSVAVDGFGYNVKVPGGLSWSIDGKNILQSQSSFFRVNGAGSELPVSSLLLDTVTSDTSTNQIVLRTEDGGKGIVVDAIYTLQPAIPGRASQILKDVRITNVSGSVMNLSWFEYFDFDLGSISIADDDSLTSMLHAGTRTITQSNSRVGLAVLSQWTMVTADGVFVFDQPVGYQLSAWRSNPNFGTPSLLEQLTDNSATTLTDSADSVGVANDYLFGVEFDFSALAAGASVSFRSISTAMYVPEPGSVALVLGGLALLPWRRRTV